MSTMYYTYPDRKQIGQIHSLGKDKGYHFTWCMYPLDFANWLMQKKHIDDVVDENNHLLSPTTFCRMIEAAKSQSFDERIE